VKNASNTSALWWGNLSGLVGLELQKSVSATCPKKKGRKPKSN
jgi:hypothetical protein